MADTFRPLPLRMRCDLTTTREVFGGRAYVIVKDPTALRYFRLLEEEHALLELLDGVRSLDDVRAALEARFAPQKFKLEAMTQFIASAHRAGMLMSNAPGQGRELLKRRSKNVRRAWLQKLMSPLAIRVRGLDPTRLFDAAYPRVQWCFSRPAMIFAGLLVIAALLLTAVRFDEVQRRMPTFHQFFTPGNVLLLLGVLGAIKVLHEFGHGLSCRHFGGECHELGLMFLVFAPCLYCNVSDAWRLPKRQRIAVSAAGIVVELVIAALAVFGWWFSGPGVFNQLCLGAIFVSSVSTLLVNGNPLMRYDGYFILADAVETPNLAEKSSQVVRQWLSRHCLGIDDEPDPMSPVRRRGWFAAYAVASGVYRILITCSIYLFLLEWLRPYQLEIVAGSFGLLALGGLVLVPLVRLVRTVAPAARREKMKRRYVTRTTMVLASAAAAVVFVPLPQRVWGTLEVEPRDAQAVYVEVPGRVIEVATPVGRPIAAGDVVARLENTDLELQIVELRGRRDAFVAQLSALRRERYDDDNAAAQIPELEKSLAAAKQLLQEKLADHDRLTLTATRDGLVLPPPETPAPKAAAIGELPTWSGLPLEQANRGATLEAGTLVCRIGDVHRWQALVAIDQADIELLAVGQVVEIRFDEMPDVTVAAKIDEISRRELSESPRHLSNKVGGELATKTDEAGVERPLSATYQARVVLYDPRGLLRIGLRGTAKIHVPPQSLGAGLARWMSRTFHFDL